MSILQDHGIVLGQDYCVANYNLALCQ